MDNCKTCKKFKGGRSSRKISHMLSISYTTYEYFWEEGRWWTRFGGRRERVWGRYRKINQMAKNKNIESQYIKFSQEDKNSSHVSFLIDDG